MPKLRKTDEILERVMDLWHSRTIQRIIIALIIAVVLLSVSGIVFATTQEVPGLIFLGSEVRVFLPSVRSQTLGETFVSFTFYLLALLGLILYIYGLQQRGTERGVRYMLFFSSLLLLISVLGIISGLLSKF